MLLFEVVRPKVVERSPDEVQRLTHGLRLAQHLTMTVSDDFETHYEVARNLGIIYAVGASLAWPAATQLSEKFLQAALTLEPSRPDALESLGFLHRLTGDQGGSLYYLEAAKAARTTADPVVDMALAQGYHLGGRDDEALQLLALVRQGNPDEELARVLEEVIQLAQSQHVFRVPDHLEAEPFRPDATRSALDFPAVAYRNIRHGFAVSYPYDWTLYDEESQYPLGPCRRLAELTLDLPLRTIDDDEELARVRLLVYPIGFGVSLDQFAVDTLPMYQYPQNIDVMDPVIEGSRQVHYKEGKFDTDEGEMVYLVDGQMGFFFHFMTTNAVYPERRAEFETFLKEFRTLAAKDFAPPGCVLESPL
ncbi:MAG: hypothetical protein AUK47_09745 [Deltaproteobacteria bacterium CG2_30_63_29]|nr:MAG: hypothetical protein AUK47_09745 [Deltaproteobacteria bacterium CG2_30_63_29]